jgi:hypothetical protein
MIRAGMRGPSAVVPMLSQRKPVAVGIDAHEEVDRVPGRGNAS